MLMPLCHDSHGVNHVSMMAFEAVAKTVPALSFTHHDFPVQCKENL